MNERDRESAWGRTRGRAQIDVTGTGWGWLGGGGARERERAHLGNTRGAVVLVCTFVWSERQRGGVELEVLDLGFCSEQGRRRELGFTQETGRWGSIVGGVHLPAWRVEERGERGWRRSWQDLAHAWLGSPSSPSFLPYF
jgi:hypothetical protein